MSLPPGERRDGAIRAVLELPDEVEILSWKLVAAMMANQLDGPGRGLNLMSREVLAAATLLSARVVMATENENRLLSEALHEVGLT